MENATEGVLRLIDPAVTYLAREYQLNVGDNMQVARIRAGRVSAEELAIAISRQAGEVWSRDKITNIENGRKRLTLTDVEMIAKTFRQDFGLPFVTLDWLTEDAVATLRADLPGYLSRTSVIDLTGDEPTVRDEPNAA